MMAVGAVETVLGFRWSRRRQPPGSGAVGDRRLRRARRRSLELDRMGPVDEAVEDRVGDRGIPQAVIPPLAWQLAGDHRRPGPIAIVDDFEEIAAMVRGYRREAPAVQDQDIDADEARQDGGVRAIGIREDQFLEETGQPPIYRRRSPRRPIARVTLTRESQASGDLSNACCRLL